MKRVRILILIVIMSFALFIIIMLYAISDIPFRHNQRFSRIMVNRDFVVQATSVNIRNDTYIAGVTKSRIFLGNNKNPFDLLIIDRVTSETEPVRLTFKNKQYAKPENYEVQIDSPFFYVMDRSLPEILIGEIAQWKIIQTISQIPYFTRAVPIGKSSFAIQAVGSAVGSSSNQNILGKISANPQSIFWNGNILTGQVDSLYSTMGLLRYSQELNRLVYTYRFRNEYIVMDTTLKLEYKSNTIDSVVHARVKPVKVTEGIYSLASPIAIVNKNTQVSGNWLFINSNLKAANESKKDFDKSSVIDVYDLKMREYRFSFYVPDYQNNKMRTFKVSNNTLIAIYDGYLITFLLGV